MADETANTSIEDEIAKVIAPLKALDAKLAMDEAEVINELEEIREKRRRLLGMLRNADPEGFPKKVYKKQKQAPPMNLYGQALRETYEVARKVIAEIGIDDEFSAEDVWSKLERPDGVSLSMLKDRVNKVLLRLREEGQVRLTGTKKGRGGGHSYRATERIFDAPVEAALNGST